MPKWADENTRPYWLCDPALPLWRWGGVERKMIPTDTSVDECRAEEARKFIMDRIDGLPPFHPLAMKVLRLVDSDSEVMFSQISFIEADPAFAAELLRWANSPLFGSQSQVTSVRHAMVLLGLNRIKAITFRVAMEGYLGGLLLLPVVRQCWLHSLACAEIAAELAVAFNSSHDVAYPAGLMHDVGRLSILKTDAREYVPLLNSAFDSPQAILTREQELFGFDHCEAGAALFDIWGFPSETIQGARDHHILPREQETPTVRAVQLSCKIAVCLGFQSVECQQGSSFAELVSQLPVSAHRRFSNLQEEFRERVVRRVEMLQLD